MMSLVRWVLMGGNFPGFQGDESCELLPEETEENIQNRISKTFTYNSSYIRLNYSICWHCGRYNSAIKHHQRAIAIGKTQHNYSSIRLIVFFQQQQQTPIFTGIID